MLAPSSVSGTAGKCSAAISGGAFEMTDIGESCCYSIVCGARTQVNTKTRPCIDGGLRRKDAASLTSLESLSLCQNRAEQNDSRLEKLWRKKVPSGEGRSRTSRKSIGRHWTWCIPMQRASTLVVV